MSRVRSFLKYWLPALVWMCVIYGASGDQASNVHSSRLIGPVVRWLLPRLSEPAVEQVVFIVRKLAHVSEYAILAMLLWRAIRRPVRDDARPWRWRDAVWAVGLAALYAGSDELHQMFVPNRQGRLHDVLIDTTGAALGLLLIRLYCWARSRRPVASPLNEALPHKR